MALEPGNVPFDETVLFLHFRNDLRNDWFSNPLNFSDMIDCENIQATILFAIKFNLMTGLLMVRLGQFLFETKQEIDFQILRQQEFLV